jgi:hypothetical protein
VIDALRFFLFAFWVAIALGATTLDLASAPLGQNAWCYVPPYSNTFFCDHSSYSAACLDAHRREIVKDGGSCVTRPGNASSRM